jgi:hypothetical protein
MVRTEFEAIIGAQRRFGLPLDEQAAARIGRAIFYQRPLRSSRHLRGRCSIEGILHGRRAPLRCPMADPLAHPCSNNLTLAREYRLK